MTEYDFPILPSVIVNNKDRSKWSKLKLVATYDYLNVIVLIFFHRGFIGVVSQPSTFSSLELGYVCTPEGQCLPVQEVDLPLWQHGENGQDPKDFAFRFKASDEWHHIQVGTTLLPVLYSILYLFIYLDWLRWDKCILIRNIISEEVCQVKKRYSQEIMHDNLQNRVLLFLVKNVCKRKKWSIHLFFASL